MARASERAMEDLIQLGGTAREEEEKEGETVGRDFEEKDKPAKLSLALKVKSLSHSSSLDSYPSTDGESLLDELLGDIRRCRTASLASTPTFVSSDYEIETDGVRDSGRSEAELKGMGVAHLRAVADNLEHEVDTVSRLLVRLLHVRDKKAGKLLRQYEKLTAILKNFAEKNDLPGHAELRFSLHRPESEEEHVKWLAAWRVLSRLPKGIPKHWRKTLWSCLAEHGTGTVDWESQFQSIFSEYSTPEDDTLGTQIVKDLHRTGTTGFSSEEEHGVLKRVLLAYARHNQAIGYCQGFNILAALILKVVDFDERMALMIQVYLIDYTLPENYFAQNLFALSADMAVFRELLKYYLPELALHMETLQKEASGTIKKSYSSENPPDPQSMHAYEPPLADVFSMQWFLTLFATTLPRKACRRVWDTVFLEGSEYVLYTAVAILAVMEKDLLQTATAADFYSAMARLSEQLRKAHIMSSAEFMQVVYAVHGCTSNPQSKSPVPVIRELREKYTYNIYPCGVQPASEGAGGERRKGRPMMAPLPSRGGSFTIEGGDMETARRTRDAKEKRRKKSTKNASLETNCLNKAFCEEGAGGGEGATMGRQIKELHEHYCTVARQPSRVSCNLKLTPPIARAYCPQQQRDARPVPYYMAYAADVPLEVVEQSRVLSGFDLLSQLQEHRRDQFVLSFTESPDSHMPSFPVRAGERAGKMRRRGERGMDGERAQSSRI